MDDQQLLPIVTAVGGLDNIALVTNCMTRLRVTVNDEGLVDENSLRKNSNVLGLIHDRQGYYEIVVGPGKAKTFATAMRQMLSGNPHGAASSPTSTVSSSSASRGQSSKEPAPSVSVRFKRACKILGGIFVPLIPGFIVSGICGSFAILIQQLVPNYTDDVVWGCLYNLLYLIQQALLAYLTAWTGYRAAEQFGGTPILGGMLGMITSMSNINDIATLLGLYNADSPLSSILMTGKGGVLAVIIGVFLLVKVEQAVDRRMPDSLKVVGTPLITIVTCAFVYVLAIMPAAGFAASALVDAIDDVCMSDNGLIRIVVGYIGACLFLPLVAFGMHHGLVALYAIQLQEIGFVTLYPALCMAGAGQVGAALSIRRKAKRCGNDKVVAIADAGIPVGFLGIGEPLVYGLTLPMGKPFITAGIGAGFGGAFVMFMQVAATSWGPSGILGLFVMDAGPAGMAVSLGAYAVGLVISYVMGFLITNAVVKEEEVADLYADETLGSASSEPEGADKPASTAVVSRHASTLATEQPESIHPGLEIDHGQLVALDGAILFAPVDGYLIPQKAIQDATFQDGYLGSCFGIEPTSRTVYAPCAGTVSIETDSRHAFVIDMSASVHVMVHVGLETVALEGAGFEPLVSVGDTVEAGQPLLNFDPDLMREYGYRDTVVTALLNDDS